MLNNFLWNTFIRHPFLIILPWFLKLFFCLHIMFTQEKGIINPNVILFRSIQNFTYNLMTCFRMIWTHFITSDTVIVLSDKTALTCMLEAFTNIFKSKLFQSILRRCCYFLLKWQPVFILSQNAPQPPSHVLFKMDYVWWYY